MSAADAVLWHDLECGGYAEDLPLWRALADDEAGEGPVVDRHAERPRRAAVLDIGAGTGRVALDLAAHGHDVVAVDADPVLLRALRDRAAGAGVAVGTVAADARGLDLGDRRFGLVLVPMQTVQLFRPQGRLAFLARARAHLRDGGVLALAIADARDSVTDERTEPPLPDVRDVGGTLYSSRPVAVRVAGDGVAIERLREVVTRSGERTATTDIVRLDHLDAATLEAEGRDAGLRPLPRRVVPQTDDYVGSTVVVLGG